MDSLAVIGKHIKKESPARWLGSATSELLAGALGGVGNFACFRKRVDPHCARRAVTLILEVFQRGLLYRHSSTGGQVRGDKRLLETRALIKSLGIGIDHCGYDLLRFNRSKRVCALRDS